MFKYACFTLLLLLATGCAKETNKLKIKTAPQFLIGDVVTVSEKTGIVTELNFDDIIGIWQYRVMCQSGFHLHTNEEDIVLFAHFPWCIADEEAPKLNIGMELVPPSIYLPQAELGKNNET